MNPDIKGFALEWISKAEQNLLWAKASFKGWFLLGCLFFMSTNC